MNYTPPELIANTKGKAALREEWLRLELRITTCQCKKPIELRRYLGFMLCARCQRLRVKP